MICTTQQSGAKAGEQLVAKGLDIQPTLTVRPGWPLTIIVHKDLALTGRRGASAVLQLGHQHGTRERSVVSD